MIPKDTKFFPDGGRLNADDSPFALLPSDLVNGENVRWGSTDNGKTAVVESIGSTRMVSSPLPSVNFVQIGSIEDTENGRAIIFYKNTTGENDKIECYYSRGELTYTVLRGADVTGGLNFSKDFPIHSAHVANGIVSWPEGTNNEPRSVNIEAGIKAYHPSFVSRETPYQFPLTFNEITVIKSPPPLAPNIQKDTDGGFLNNFIANDSFEFVFQYVWYDNETTVVGTYSANSRLNKSTDTYNYINVEMDESERIPSRVRIVRLIVRYSNSNNAKVIKTWDKEVAAEATEIENQNLGTPLSYDFYNNVDGEAIAEDDVLRPFDSVPIYSEAHEIAKNRRFFGNNTEGYDTPNQTSLSISIVTTDIAAGAALTKNLISIKAKRYVFPNSILNWAYSGYFIFITELAPVGYYLVNGTDTTVAPDGLDPVTYPPLPSAPPSVTTSGLTFKGATLNDVFNATKPVGFANKTDSAVQTLSNTIQITGTSIPTYDIFKTKGLYKYGIVFYDYAMRKCGVVTKNNFQFTIPSRNFLYSTGVNAAVWSLSNTNAIDEIPEWAYYYAPVRTLNQTTRFFVDSITTAAKYAQKNPDGTYTFTSNTFVTGALGIGLNTTALYQSGLGYVFTEGDVCILTRDDNTQYELPVIGQNGNYIIVKSGDIGTLENREFVFEIYTPYRTSEQEPFYEVGELYRVSNPTTVDRQYETVGGTFLPDAYVLTRSYLNETYFAEAMCPNDAFYQRWDNDSGKINIVTKLGQVTKINSISFSDTFVPNTAINGMGTFRALNQKAVPEDNGAITRLVLTSKVQTEGTVMLAICRVETSSLYLGEVQITDNTGATQFFSASDGVIGTINTLKGNYGSIDPTAVAQYRGNVYFLDRNNGRIVQYSVNGLDVISDYKMVRFWKQWCLQYQSMTAAQVEALGDRPFVFMTVDSSHGELLISIPKLSNTPPKGFLPDYPSTIYPFDILDFQGKTMKYRLGVGQELPHWQPPMTFTTEGFLTLQNMLFSFKNGNMYMHNQTTSQNIFYGVQYTSKIMPASNIAPQFTKPYLNISVESNIVPNFVYFYNDYPYQQSSDLEDFDFRSYEGIWYATIKRNKLIPTATGFTTDGLMTGEVMRNTAMLIEIEFAPTTTPLELRFITIGFTVSRGLKLPTQ